METIINRLESELQVPHLDISQSPKVIRHSKTGVRCVSFNVGQTGTQTARIYCATNRNAESTADLTQEAICRSTKWMNIWIDEQIRIAHVAVAMSFNGIDACRAEYDSFEPHEPILGLSPIPINGVWKRGPVPSAVISMTNTWTTAVVFSLNKINRP